MATGGLSISLDNLGVRCGPGRLRRARARGTAATLETDGASVELESVGAGIVRVTWRPSESWENDPTSYAAERRRRRAPTWRHSRRCRLLTAGAARVEYESSPLALRFSDERGVFLAEDTDGGFGYMAAGVALRWKISKTERIYGLGQNAFADFNRVGQRRSMAADHEGHVGGDVPIPFWISSRGYGVLVDNPNVGHFDLTGRGRIVYRSEDGYATYYVLWGPTPKEVLRRYAELTGFAPMPPRWFLGPMFCRIPGGDAPGYRSDREVVALARRFRKHGIPADCLILDYQWDEWIGAYRWDRKKFGRARWMIAELEKLGFRTIVQLKPAVNESAGTVRELKRRGLALTRGDGTVHTGNYHRGRSIFLDVFDARTRRWLWSRLRRLMADGVAGWWTDEGDWLGYTRQTTRDLQRSPTAMRNRYNNAWCQAIYDGQRSETDRRVVNITRAGWAGVQRFGTTVWTGDVSTTWRGLEAQLQMGLNMAMSGVPFWTTDGGGFLEKDPTPELFIRWAQLAVFCPITRFHGCGPREPWHYGRRAERIVREMLRWRMRLLPYLYGAAWQAATSGMPIMRPMALEYPRETRFSNVTSQYFLGPSLLVRPVTAPMSRVRRGGGRIDIELGGGRWYDFWSGAALPSGRTARVEARIESPPVLVRGPAIVVLAAPTGHTRGQSRDELTIRVYLGDMRRSWSASFDLHEDDGATYAYETTRHPIIRLSCERTTTRSFRLATAGRGASGGGTVNKRWRLEVYGADRRPIVTHAAARRDMIPVARAFAASLPTDEAAVRKSFLVRW